MANRWIDSLRRYGGTKAFMLNGVANQAWAQVDADFSLAQDGAGGEWSLRIGGGVGEKEARRVFGAASGEVFIGFGLICDVLPTTEPDPDAVISNGGFFLAKLRDAANGDQVSVYLGTDGALVVYRNGELGGSGDFNGVKLGRTIPVIGPGGRHHVEIYLKPHSTAGAIEIRVDETTRLNLTGANTQGTGNVEVSQWALGHDVNAGISSWIEFRDLYVNDATDDGSGCNTFIGDCKAGCLMVNADTAQADFALSTGSVGYTLLNETPPNDTTFISLAGTTGESDFGLENPPANTTEILTARPWIRVSKDDAGTCTMAPNMKSGATKGTVAGSPAATAPGYLDACVPLDPAAAIPWTLTTLSAALHVVERTA